MKTVKGTNKLALVIKKVAEKMATVSCGTASFWGIHILALLDRLRLGGKTI